MLEKHHIKQLEMSAISIRIAEQCELNTIKDKSIAEEIIGMSGIPEPPYLSFPYHNLFNRDEVISYSLRPDNPSPPKQKYLKRKNAPTNLYVPRTVSMDDLLDTKKPLIITEGEKKALSAISSGLIAVSIPGVYNFLTRYPGQESTTPLKEFGEINFKGRATYIAFDSDIYSNWSIQNAENKLAEFLVNLGAEVKCVRFPKNI